MTYVVNGTTYTIDCDPNMPLLWALRDVVGLTGSSAEVWAPTQAVGKPVQLVWSREEGLGLDDTGAVTTYQSRIVTPSPLY